MSRSYNGLESGKIAEDGFGDGSGSREQAVLGDDFMSLTIHFPLMRFA